MKKIICVIPSISDNNGIVSFFKIYIQQILLISNEFKFELICSNYNVSTDNLSFFNKIGVKVNLISTFMHGAIKEINSFYEHNNFDIMHCNVPSIGYFHIKSFKKNNKNGIVIQHSHATKFSSSFLKSLFHKVLYKKSIKYTNTRIACSNAAGKFLFRNYDFRIVYNCVKKSENRKSIHDVCSIGDDELIVAFIGRLAKQKNPFFLFKIYNELKRRNVKFKLLIIGNGDLKKKLEKIAIKENYDSIIFLNPIQDITNYMSSMDCIVMPSRFEGLPLVAVESQVERCKVLVSKNVTNEVIISNYCKKVYSFDEKEWVDEILRDKVNYVQYNNYDLYNINHGSKKLLSIYCDGDC